MSTLNVTSIASLEALNSALSQYRAASGEPFRRFAPIFSEKLELLAQLETHFVGKVGAAENQLEYAQNALYFCQNNPDRISCSYEAGMVRRARAELAQAQENLATYHSLMSRIQNALGAYQSAASRYENNLQNISSAIVPNFSSLIGEMKAYSFDSGDIADGGVTAGGAVGYGVDSSPSLSAFRTAAINAGVVGVANKGTASGKGIVDLSGDSAAGTAESASGESGFSPNTTAVGVVAGVSVAAVSAGILLHFRNNGIDNHFACREIDRVLTEKYGAPVGLLPPEKQAEYVRDYNALSKAVEEDVKKQNTEEVENLRKKENEKRAKDNQLSIEDAEHQYEYASLADHVYLPNQKLPENWSIVSSQNSATYELVKEIKRLNNDGSGFYAELYQNDITGEYTLAFRGTEFPKPNDLATDGLQALGLSKQYEDAKLLGDKINELGISKENLKIVGHSLGGGLATVAGLESQCQTYTYNQAELSHATISFLNLNTDGHEKIITQYIDRNQWLNSLVQDPINNALSEKRMVAINKSEFNFAQRMIEASEKFKTDSPDNFFARLGTVKTIDSKGEHGIKFVKDFFYSQKREDLYGNQLKDFHISEMSEAPTLEDSSLRYFQQAGKDAGIIGVVSKK